MRCRQCMTTGYTEDELQAHVKETGHKLPANRKDWDTFDEFPESAVARKLAFTRDELIAALREAKITPEDLAAAPEGAPP